MPHFDVLIIGSGLAGLTLALNLASSRKVGLITKKALLDGASGWAQGGIAAAVGPGDSPALPTSSNSKPFSQRMAPLQPMAMACAFFGIELKVYMVKVSYFQKPYRRALMETWGATVHRSPSPETEAGRGPNRDAVLIPRDFGPADCATVGIQYGRLGPDDAPARAQRALATA